MNNQSLDIIEGIGARMTPARQRPYALWFLLTAVVLLLTGRSFYLQIVKGTELRSRAEQNRVDQLVIPAPRGLIYDRDGRLLVENISNTDLIFDPALLPVQENEGYLIDNLIRLLPASDPETIKDSLMKARTTQRPSLVARALDHDTVLSLQESAHDIVGVRLMASLVRRYLYPQPLAHVLGYTGAVTAEELAQDGSLYLTDTTGKSGIEKTYDTMLRGTHGWTYTEVNAAGAPQTDLGRVAPIPGQDVRLTLDVELQTRLYDLFARQDQDKFAKTGQHTSGAAVVMNPQSGEMLALVSYPAFDPNTFSQPSLLKDNEAFIDDTRNPLFNRATTGTYQSGSVIKPFIAAGALQEGLINASTTVFSTGGISIGPWRFPDWKAGGHGTTDVKKAIAESVNTFFYMITGGLDTQPGLGVEKTLDYLRKFGWAEPTGIDLPAEAAGFLPSRQWKEETKGERWYIGDTYHLGIGQGDVLVTPLQVATATAALANGQKLPQPHLVTKDTKSKSLNISPTHIETIRQAMRQAVTEGSGRGLAALPVAIAGKTGTAQIGGSQETHAWFTSFGPYDNPELVVTVLLERGGEGDEQAVPFARQIWQWWIEQRP